MSQGVSINVLEQAAELESRIANARVLEVSLNEERSRATRAVRAARLRYGYRQLQQWVRIPAESYSLWPLGILIVASLLSGQLVVMLTTLFAGLGLLAFLLGVVAAAATAVLFWQMLWGTSKAELPLITEQTRLDLREAQNASVRVHLEIEALLSSLKADEEWLHSIRHSIHWNREKLLRRNWRAMRDSEWEHFLADVLRALGWDTTVLGQSGDQGVDLVVTRDDRRYAIQAKGYHHSVGNKAVQEAVAGMAHHGCNACAVITNSIYTRGAVELAASNCCVLIGEADIPALGRGKLAPFDAEA